VQQNDTTPRFNTPQTIETAQSLGDISDQVKKNQADFPEAMKKMETLGKTRNKIARRRSYVREYREHI